VIRIEFPEPADEAWVRWRKACEEATRALVDHHEHGKGEAVEPRSDLYARRTIKKKYYCDRKDKGLAPFFSKCAYCETQKDILHVEHFRPKKAVDDEEDRNIERIRPDGTSKRHPGYYWLAYDWQNLLLACDDCNGGYKRNRFPLEDESTRAWSSTDDLSAERPLLVNPLVEDPAEHLSLDVETGILVGHTDRGRKTIEVLGLNREPLPENRRSTITSVEFHYQRAVSGSSTPDQRAKAKRFLAESQRGRHGSTMAARSAIWSILEHSRFLSKP